MDGLGDPTEIRLMTLKFAPEITIWNELQISSWHVLSSRGGNFMWLLRSVVNWSSMAFDFGMLEQKRSLDCPAADDSEDIQGQTQLDHLVCYKLSKTPGDSSQHPKKQPRSASQPLLGLVAKFLASSR